MSKLSISASIAIILSCLLGVIVFRNSLNNSSIIVENIKEDTVKRKSSKNGPVTYQCRLQKDFNRTVCLRNYKSSNIVAVVAKDSTGNILLNPRKRIGFQRFHYGPIPRLENISKKQLDALWLTKSLNSKENIVTYELNAGPNDDKKMEFFIDTIFTSNKLAKYRIRSNITDFFDSDWIKV